MQAGNPSGEYRFSLSAHLFVKRWYIVVPTLFPCYACSMHESFPHAVPESDEARLAREAQLLPNHLSVDFRNAYVALWGAATKSDSEMIRSILEVTPDGRVQKYTERFADDGVIRSAMGQADSARVTRIDAIVEQLNAMLHDPATMDFSAFTALCQQLDNTLTGKSESAPDSGETA